MQPTTIGGINKLDEAEKRAIYAHYIPKQLIQKFDLPELVKNEQFLQIRSVEGASDVEMKLYHEPGFQDPVLYAHLTDTLNGQIHVLLYILNDPASPRFDVDRMPDGSPTRFGILKRNIPAEQAALQAGLSPGQVRRGLRLLEPAMIAFEEFISSLGHETYFIEPLYYHNAVIFERHGFAYQVGKRRMEAIQAGFQPGGELRQKLDDSTPFRSSKAADSIRLRSWAIHDGILGEPFTDVTMYKRIGSSAGMNTVPDSIW
ncbi:MAG TPA: hypothetical protein VJ785_15305 [Anaerolineales bacterium]|nr:hypothetical protein [Anaerolineales bacterium]